MMMNKINKSKNFMIFYINNSNYFFTSNKKRRSYWNKLKKNQNQSGGDFGSNLIYLSLGLLGLALTACKARITKYRIILSKCLERRL